MKPGRDKERPRAEKAETPAALRKPRQPGRIRAFFLAAVVHAAFFALIVFGVTWQSSPTAPLVAELWDKLPPAVKPEPAAKPPEPEPPKPEPVKPEPEKKPEPPKPEPPKPDVKPEPPKPDPAIAEKAKREKEKRERLERERLEREKEEKRKVEEAKKKREQEEAARKREQEETAKKKQEEERRRREEETRKREADKARAEAAARKQSEVDKYIEQIKSKIRGKANVPDNVAGNPEVQVRLRILPGGEVLEATVTRSSGNRAYDSAIERAIRSASPLPVPPPDSELFPQFRDLILNIRHER